MNSHHIAADGLDAPRQSKRAGVVASVLVALGLVGVAVGLAGAPVTASSPTSDSSLYASSCQSGSVCIVPQAVRWQ